MKTFNLDKNLFSSFNGKGLWSSRNVKNTALPGILVIANPLCECPFYQSRPTQTLTFLSNLVTENILFSCFL